MVCNYKPKIKCECGEEFFDYSDNDSATCNNCNKTINKELHGLEGAETFKDNNGNYVLKFPEFKEEDVFARWEELLCEMNKLEGHK